MKGRHVCVCKHICAVQVNSWYQFVAAEGRRVGQGAEGAQAYRMRLDNGYTAACTLIEAANAA